ncbi:MAG TPA: acetyltransferase [Longimicrobium sp.]|nr:acetyltransferase [Longimicrobium sp.]
MATLQDGVHPVTPEDFPRMLEVWEESVRATHDFLAEADIQKLKPLVAEVFHHPMAMAAVRDQAGQVAGFLGADAEKLEMLFIHPSFRGGGAGRRLVRHAVDVLGATAVDVNEQNGQAVGFYLRMGFEVVGRSELDGQGNPFPLLHMRLPGTQSDETA